MSIAAIRDLISDDLKQVDEVIRASLYSDVALIRQVAEYTISAGGKRLRPALVLLAAGIFGYQGRQHYDLAAVVEFIHTSTLLHDDVVDASELRRGKASANALFGNAAAVLVGDFVYSRSFQLMVSVNNMRVLEVLAEATNTIAEGEVLQLVNSHNFDVNAESYLKVIRYKTAKLFEAAARLGAVVGGASRAEENALGKYGMHLGTAFQLVDDILDYSGDAETTGKNLGDDLSEGKTTLPLIYAMQHGNSEQAELIREVVGRGGRDQFAGVLTAIIDTGALEFTREQAQAEAQAAKRALASFPRSRYSDCLLQLADFSVTRNY
ncbi:MAG TPA: polyprenyl synthetase family protein [Burkholderiales bacterium]|nr:polyprenyl synthetase family protein [Burkholderiales bacterium]